MSNQLTLLFSKPPKVEVKNFRKYIVILITCIVGTLGHIGFATLFWFFQVDILFSFNLFGAVLWVCIGIINYQAKHAQAIFLICLELLLIITLTISLLGLDFGFQLYFWPVACLAVINPSLKKLHASLIGFGFIIAIVLLKYFFDGVQSDSPLVEYASTIYMFNAIIAGIPLVIGIASIREINESQEKVLTELATIDELTGLYNRRYINSYLRRYYKANAGNDSAHHCVVLGDIDHFKRINDNFGHDVGDTVLQVISARLKSSFRKVDIVCRWGGEEFLIVLHEADAQKAYRIVDRIRQEIAGSIEVDESNTLTVTMSFGIASTMECEGSEQLIKLADENLYQAKNNGRNCVIVNPVTDDIAKVVCPEPAGLKSA
ncbi:GGDEF domain-containing protein [Leucothrix mucor]|uniref:GGDEF domain-containing protein n=1 Tax=Leucothrix mucor TaxID=45248 RepID=UPI0003B40C0D|nr:GGDEF domain-containing protein [Leucothrix mucor]